MSGKLIVLGFGFMAALAATDVSAQSGYYGGAGNSVRCESNDGRMVYCGGSRDAQLQRQVSKTPCIRGQTWGTDNRGLWVAGGCRGDFLVGGGYGYGNGNNNGWQGGNGQVFRCESNDKRIRQCASNGVGNVRLVRQLSGSPCIEGQSWGRERNGVWVSRGCRAEFQVVQGRGPRWDRWRDGGHGGNGYGNNGYGNQQTVRCESNDGRTHRCGANIDRGVQVTRQLSSSPCIEGQNWGWDRNGIWVSGGCRAEFGVW